MTTCFLCFTRTLKGHITGSMATGMADNNSGRAGKDIAGDSKRRKQNNTGAFKRPRSVKSCDDVEKANVYRASTLSEISQNLAKINDPLLTEYQIRDTNDTINALLRERRAWEYRIKELGGIDYTKVQDTTGSFNFKGYRYFGRARELPDVVKLLEEATIEKTNSKSVKDELKNLKNFNDGKNWNSYLLDVKESLPLFDEDESVEILSFKPSAEKPLTEDLEYMKQFLLKEKKKYLLQRIRSKK